jgi:8-oxo-dGTP diphosphatase
VSPPAVIAAVGAVVLDEAGRLLVVQRGHAPAAGRWSIPGGRIEPGETAPAAAAREVAEETGLEVEVAGLVGHLDVITADHHIVILDFRARVVGGALVAGDDAAAVRWVTRTELAALETSDGLVDFLDAHGIPLAP